MAKPEYGYNGRILRVNLTTRDIWEEELDEKLCREYLGGASMGIRMMYDLVPPETNWDEPENRIVIAAGPISGSRMKGSGCIAVVTQGALTNSLASSQAGGFFGAYLRMAGYDMCIIEGKADSLVYLVIDEHGSSIKDAEYLRDEDSFETNDILKRDLHMDLHDACVMAIGQAGTNLVRMACVSVDKGHMLAHNGIGAVFGSKNLKAVVAVRAPMKIKFHDVQKMRKAVADLSAYLRSDFMLNNTLHWGTSGGVYDAPVVGFVPCHNYTTNDFKCTPEQLENFKTQNIRAQHKVKCFPCWCCDATHCHEVVLQSGTFKGMEVEEPEYESMAAFSATIDVFDSANAMGLNGLCDRYCMDANETGYLMSFVMECYEKGILTKEDLGGIEMTWGNEKAVAELMKKIVYREGIGDILANGVKKASEAIGKGAEKIGVYTMKGNTPRGHDHRVMWFEHFDTCVSSLGTIESHTPTFPAALLEEPVKFDTFDWLTIAHRVAKGKGCMMMEDSIVNCRFQSAGRIDLTVEGVNGSTGWDMTWQEAQRCGRRALHLARVYGFRKGLTPDLDWPSPRYGRTPENGRSKDHGITTKWTEMLQLYYKEMGWDQYGFPTEETLRDFGLDFAVEECNYYRNKYTPMMAGIDFEEYKKRYINCNGV